MISIPVVKDSNYPHETPRKEEFCVRLTSIHTICFGLTSILWISQIVEVIEISLNNLVKRNILSEGGNVSLMLSMCKPIFGTGKDVVLYIVLGIVSLD